MLPIIEERQKMSQEYVYEELSSKDLDFSIKHVGQSNSLVFKFIIKSRFSSTIVYNFITDFNDECLDKIRLIHSNLKEKRCFYLELPNESSPLSIHRSVLNEIIFQYNNTILKLVDVKSMEMITDEFENATFHLPDLTATTSYIYNGGHIQSM